MVEVFTNYTYFPYNARNSQTFGVILEKYFQRHKKLGCLRWHNSTNINLGCPVVVSAPHRNLDISVLLPHEVEMIFCGL